MLYIVIPLTSRQGAVIRYGLMKTRRYMPL